MAENLQLIRELTPRTKSWTVKVQVIEKSEPRTSLTSRRFQRLLLQDSELTRIQATIFGSNIELYNNALIIGKKYYISNATVREIASEHRIVPNQYQWTINGGTLVEEITDDAGNDNGQMSIYHFIPFSELSLHMKADATVDIIAIALEVFPPREIRTRNGPSTNQDILLIKKEMKPTILTMWDEFFPNECNTISNIIDSWPEILAARLKVLRYKGLYLSTKSTSFIMANPEIPEATALRSWSIQHTDELRNVLLERDQEKVDNIADNIIDIGTAMHMESLAPFWIKATASIIDFCQKFWYVGCSTCFTTILVECGRIYNCRHCETDDVTAVARCRFKVELHDSTGSLKANCFGANAEFLFPIIAAEILKKRTNEEGVTDEDFLKTIPASTPQVLCIQPYRYEFAGTTQRRLSISSIQNGPSETPKAKKRAGGSSRSENRPSKFLKVTDKATENSEVKTA